MEIRVSSTYDSLYQLAAVSGAQTHSYTYDPVGNRTLADGIGYSPNTLNQYLTVGGAPYTYDDNGNLTSDGAKTYTYDFENRLTSVTGPGLTAQYAYDGFGRGVKKTVNGITTYYLHDGDQVIEERGSGGVLQATYTFGPGIDEVLTMNRASQTYYYFHDGLGSVTDLTKSTGELVESYSYDAYGQPSAPSTLGNPYMFTGREYDSETGLFHYRRRYYDPLRGRFLSRDPLTWGPDDPRVFAAHVLDHPGVWPWIGVDLEQLRGRRVSVADVLKQGILATGSSYPVLSHPYSYVANNPVNWIDPWGWEKQKPWWDKLGEGYYYGTGFGQEAAEWYAEQQITTGSWLWTIPGSIASLWTPKTYQATGWTLVSAAAYTTGFEIKIGNNVRIAPFGNRTGHPFGERPHYHRRIIGPDGKTVPGEGIGWHRPWQRGF